MTFFVVLRIVVGAVGAVVTAAAYFAYAFVILLLVIAIALLHRSDRLSFFSHSLYRVPAIYTAEIYAEDDIFFCFFSPLTHCVYTISDKADDNVDILTPCKRSGGHIPRSQHELLTCIFIEKFS